MNTDSKLPEGVFHVLYPILVLAFVVLLVFSLWLFVVTFANFVPLLRTSRASYPPFLEYVLLMVVSFLSATYAVCRTLQQLLRSVASQWEIRSDPVRRLIEFFLSV